MLVFIIFIILVLLVVYCSSLSREKFGGPVSGPDRLRPKECINVCDQYYDYCMKKYGDLDAGACNDYFKVACRNSCLYNPYHLI